MSVRGLIGGRLKQCVVAFGAITLWLVQSSWDLLRKGNSLVLSIFLHPVLILLKLYCVSRKVAALYIL